jgi:predicted nuclease of predicted toxin-antitoxin system
MKLLVDQNISYRIVKMINDKNWLRTGNCSTNVLAGTILRNAETIHDFLLDKSLDCLEIF